LLAPPDDDMEVILFSEISFFFLFSRKSLALLLSSLTLVLGRDCERERLEPSPASECLSLRFRLESSPSLDDSSFEPSSFSELGFC
jgi:hypothetical protein